MRIKTLLGSLGLLAGLAATSGKAAAQTPGFTVNRFEPSERGSEWFYTESLDFRGKARPVIGVVADYMYRPFVLRRDPNDDRVTNSVVRNVFTIHPGVSFVLFERLRLAASLPIQLFQDSGNDQQIVREPQNHQAIGDLRLGADFRLLGSYGGPASLAVGAQVWLPTGSKDNYTSDGSVRVAPRLLLAGNLGAENFAFTYGAKAGFLFRGDTETIGRGRTGDELQLAASVGARIGKRLVVGPEWYMNTVVTNLGADATGRKDKVFGKEETAMEWLLGAHYTIPADFRVGAAAGTGLGKAYGNPEARVLLNLEYMPKADTKKECADRDRDGVCDSEDSCPDVQGARSSNPSANGCPPDRDGDGVYDTEDACLDIPGEKTSDPKTNGCPPDKDGDGIFDRDDACPDVAGVKSDDPKKNGCPPDSDGDGILDNVDACPDKPGIKTDDPKTNGCPDPDRDKDGVLNDADACPDEPGKADPDPKKNGCPKAFVKDGQIKILDQVKFKYNSAAIEAGPFSEEILQAVMGIVQKHTEIKGIRIEGHTDNKGSPAYNKTLSKNRANSVAQWLVNHGIDTSILAVEGFGQEKPIDSNDTDAGRANNRRVEFHILDAAPATPVKLKGKSTAALKTPGPGTPKPTNPPGTKPGTTNGTGKK